MLQSDKQDDTWKAFSLFISDLLEEKMLNCENFEEQCLAMYKYDLDDVTLDKLSKCFGEIAKSRENYEDEKFTMLLDFLSNFCGDMSIEC